MGPVSMVTVTGAGGGVSFDAGPPPTADPHAAAGAEPVVVRANADAVLVARADGDRLGLGV